jgi:hypothetical protein
MDFHEFLPESNIRQHGRNVWSHALKNLSVYTSGRGHSIHTIHTLPQSDAVVVKITKDSKILPQLTLSIAQNRSRYFFNHNRQGFSRQGSATELQTMPSLAISLFCCLIIQNPPLICQNPSVFSIKLFSPSVISRFRKGSLEWRDFL